MEQVPENMSETDVSVIACERLAEIREVIQTVRQQGSMTDELYLADHLLSMSELAFLEIFGKHPYAGSDMLPGQM
jgi:regulator of RNase E activity RraB